MNAIRALCVLVISGVLALAQDAGPVVVVKESDAKIAKEAYEKYVAAKDTWEKAKAELEKKYRAADFNFGILFTPDFRFAVPKPYEPQGNPFCGPIYGGGHNDYGSGITLTPGYALAN